MRAWFARHFSKTVNDGLPTGMRGSPLRGNAYGEALYAAAQKPEGQITEVPSYMFPKPGTTAPTFPKVSFVTRVGDLGCGVGYYK
jgi:hypothetical protein